MCGGNFLRKANLDERLATFKNQMDRFALSSAIHQLNQLGEVAKRRQRATARVVGSIKGNSMTGRAAAGLLALTAWISCAASAADQPPPLPPARPKASVTSPAPVAPAPPAEQTQSTTDDAVGTLPPPRIRIERCATEWRDMKRVGSDVGLTWRNFAQSCYKR
jgi:hypothetical protein